MSITTRYQINLDNEFVGEFPLVLLLLLLLKFRANWYRHNSCGDTLPTVHYIHCAALSDGLLYKCSLISLIGYSGFIQYYPNLYKYVCVYHARAFFLFLKSFSVIRWHSLTHSFIHSFINQRWQRVRVGRHAVLMSLCVLWRRRRHRYRTAATTRNYRHRYMLFWTAR